MTVEDWLERHFDRATDYVLITGASSGIGLEYLRAFAKCGCNCIATSNDADELAAACSSVNEQFAIQTQVVVADLSSNKGLQDLLAATTGYRIAVVINNAGFGLKGPFVTHSAASYSELIHLNAVAPTVITRTILPSMLAAKRGLLIHVASINACSPIGFNAAYTATKAYLLYLVYAMAYELKGSPLLFQILLPGTTRTPFHERQGAVPSAMYMEPDLVVRRSLRSVDSGISISNRLDRVLFPFVMALPLWARIRLATYLLKKRLKIGN